MIERGLPDRPLPSRWWAGLSRARVRAVVSVELRGNPRVMPTRHQKGYVRLYLGRGHPYADKGGTGLLHRWIMQRAKGRRLETYEHVHHRNGDKRTEELEELQVLEAVDHGLMHYGVHFERRAGRLEFLSCGEEYTPEELEELACQTV